MLVAVLVYIASYFGYVITDNEFLQEDKDILLKEPSLSYREYFPSPARQTFRSGIPQIKSFTAKFFRSIWLDIIPGLISLSLSHCLYFYLTINILFSLCFRRFFMVRNCFYRPTEQHFWCS